MTMARSVLSGIFSAALLMGGSPTAHAVRADCTAARDAVLSQIEASCPCDATSLHADYVRCVTRKLRELSACTVAEDGTRACGPLPRMCVGTIRKAASRSACGNGEAVTCCLPKQHDCVGDPTPGDGSPQGICSGSDRPCDRVTDCVLSKCHLAPSADRCRVAGGTPGRGKDCSTACTP